MKRVIQIVIGVHVAALLWMALWLPVKKKQVNPIEIHTVVQAPPPVIEKVIEKPMVTPVKAVAQPKPKAKSKPKPKTRPKPKPKPKAPPVKKVVAVKKPAPKKKPQEKGPQVSESLLKELDASIAKIEQKQAKKVPTKKISAPKFIASLQIDTIDEDEGNPFGALLISCLQSQLKLPEVGEVKVKLTLTKKGKFVTMHVVNSENMRNQKFLEDQLPFVKFPALSGKLKKKEEYTFVITFCNE